MLVFLDIDGVMVPAQSWKRPEIMEDGFPAFGHTATRVLREVISENTTVFLTTSHKSRFTIDEWKAIFNNRGITVIHLFSFPESPFLRSRKEEILDWFTHHQMNEPFVILDDDKSLNDLPQHLKKNLIQPVAHIGLTESHLPEIKTILEGRG